MSDRPSPSHPTTGQMIDRLHHETAGYSTTELLANAALAIGAVVLIWGAISGLGGDVIDWISGEIMGG